MSGAAVKVMEFSGQPGLGNTEGMMETEMSDLLSDETGAHSCKHLRETQ